MDAMVEFERRALTMLTGTSIRRAFDLSREGPRLRDRYGRKPIGRTDAPPPCCPTASR